MERGVNKKARRRNELKSILKEEGSKRKGLQNQLIDITHALLLHPLNQN
jgi:hypothetical protein